MIACKQTSHNPAVKDTEVSYPSVKITTPAGEVWADDIVITNVPALFNIGRLQPNVYVAILGESAGRQKRIDFKPIAQYSLDVNQYSIKVILAVNPHSNNVKNYYDWSINNVEYKALVEQWFRTVCVGIDCSGAHWQNDLVAMRTIDSSSK